jgi:hypothetical protein
MVKSHEAILLCCDLCWCRFDYCNIFPVIGKYSRTTSRDDRTRMRSHIVEYI